MGVCMIIIMFNGFILEYIKWLMSILSNLGCYRGKLLTMNIWYYVRGAWLKKVELYVAVNYIP